MNRLHCDSIKEVVSPPTTIPIVLPPTMTVTDPTECHHHRNSIRCCNLKLIKSLMVKPMMLKIQRLCRDLLLYRVRDSLLWIQSLSHSLDHLHSQYRLQSLSENHPLSPFWQCHQRRLYLHQRHRFVVSLFCRHRDHSSFSVTECVVINMSMDSVHFHRYTVSGQLIQSMKSQPKSTPKSPSKKHSENELKMTYRFL